MSGHSKWSTIKHKKAKTDSARAVVFQKYSRELIVAAKLGGPDPAGNFRLRTAIEKAKAAGLPNDNIKRAIEKGAGQSSADNYEEITYEGYAAGGVAVVVEAMTDNKNRTAGDIRSYFTKFNGNLGETGCVGWMFDKKGCITFDKSVDYEQLFEAAINLDAEDIEDDEENYRVITSYEKLQSVTEGLEQAGFKSVTAEFTRIPQNEIEVTDEKIATNIMRLYTRLDEHDDVQNVYMNFDIADDLMEKLDY
ncbi:MAG: YebC/PmpR family DNA-binding transcriptional regulator [Cyanobacteria bacterium RUI128]|nr:YebC/PmpR family DNA-binding transcriptional regulator [Cyanobacteria bacterium RUI128]